MLDDAFVLQCMRYRARSQRYLINVRHFTPEKAEGFVRSGDSPAEPEWPEELKAQHRRLWPSLSSQEQRLLANWRAKHFECSWNGTLSLGFRLCCGTDKQQTAHGTQSLTTATLEVAACRRGTVTLTAPPLILARGGWGSGLVPFSGKDREKSGAQSRANTACALSVGRHEEVTPWRQQELFRCRKFSTGVFDGRDNPRSRCERAITELRLTPSFAAIFAAESP